MKLDVCNLERTEVILGMLWLATYNPEINWEIEEVKMIRCLALCGKNREKKEKRELRKREEQEEEEAIRQTVDKKKDWEKEKKMEIDHKKYHKWSLTICDGYFDTLKSSKMRSQISDKRCC